MRNSISHLSLSLAAVAATACAGRAHTNNLLASTTYSCDGDREITRTANDRLRTPHTDVQFDQGLNSNDFMLVARLRDPAVGVLRAA